MQIAVIIFLNLVETIRQFVKQILLYFLKSFDL